VNSPAILFSKNPFFKGFFVFCCEFSPYPNRGTNSIYMQQLTEKQIQDFMLLWKNRFGYDISRKEAFEKGIKLVRLLELTYKPMSVADFEIIQKKLSSLNKVSYWHSQSKNSADTKYPIESISTSDYPDNEKEEVNKC
jgi:hypothetical protein